MENVFIISFFMLWYSLCIGKIFLFFTILALQGQRTTLIEQYYIKGFLGGVIWLRPWVEAYVVVIQL